MMVLSRSIRRTLKDLAKSFTFTGTKRKGISAIKTSSAETLAETPPAKTLREGNAEITARALKIRTFKMEVYERLASTTILSKLTPLLAESRVAIDVGGNVGHIAYFLSQHVEQVYTFEAVDAVFEQLKKVTELAPNVIPQKCAISDFCGEADFFVDHNRLSNSGLHNVGEVEVSFKPKTEFKTKKSTVKSIDSLGIEDVGFIKIDVEGSELDVLKGAVNTIAKYHPEFCQSHGYVCYYFDSQTSGLQKIDTIEACLDAVATKHHLHDGDFLFTRKQLAMQAAA